MSEETIDSIATAELLGITKNNLRQLVKIVNLNSLLLIILNFKIL